MRLVLASASPRRRELLALLQVPFEVEPADIDETPVPDEVPRDYVLRMAEQKAAASHRVDAVVLAADTSVVIGNDILGKPGSRAEGRAMLSRLSGCHHQVLTAIAVRDGERLESILVATEVSFTVLGDEQIDDYLDSPEPWDKAGAYGIQGFAGSFVRSISGSYSAVVGLPLCETRDLLARFGIRPERHG